MSSDARCRRSIVLYTILALGLAGGYWLLFFLHERGLSPFDPSGFVTGAARGYGPAVAALVTAALLYGKSELREIGSRLTRWRVPGRLYALALLGPVAASIAMVVVLRWLGVEAQEAQPIGPGKLILIFLLFVIADGPLGEEIGWRGFFLPRLLERWGPLGGSLVLGLVWYVWHLPLYHAVGRELTGAFLAGYLVNNVSWAFVHTWFFQRSGRSAFLSVVLHTSGNYFVYLAMTLFPEVGTAPQARFTHLTLLAIAGLAAGVSLARRGTDALRA